MPRATPRIFLVIVALILGLAGRAEARPKTDVVVLINGDQITCEIKRMTRGKLTISTDSMGTIDVEWADVAAIKSNFYFRIEASSGQRYFGALELREGTTVLRVISVGVIASVEMETAVEITPIEESFWEKMDGSLSVGFSYTRASNVAEFNFDWANRYLTERNLFDLGVKTMMTDKGDSTDVVQRIDITVSYARLLKKKWTGNVSGTASRNDELDLRRRLLLSLTTGVSPIKDSSDVLMFSAGIAVNSEISTNDIETESLEGVFSGSYSRFIYNTPKTDISTALKFYPSLTERGRYRVNLDIKFRREIVKDLFFDLSYYLEYDSQASSGEGSKKDYGIVTSIGWSY